MGYSKIHTDKLINGFSFELRNIYCKFNLVGGGMFSVGEIWQ
jgi:hypothetical protein